MSAPQKITLARAVQSMPFEIGTLYNGHNKGRFPFLSRVSPEGRKTKEIWVDVPAATEWLEARGFKFTGGGKS
jgi:hypothetical protein